MKESLLEWQGYSHNYTEHTPDWYWTLGIVTVGGAVLAFFFSNVIFGIFILLAGLVLGLLAIRRPDVVTIRVGPHGIQVGDMRYPFSNFNAFWIDTDHRHGTRILLHPISSVLPLSTITVGDDVDPEALANILNDYLDEIPMRESAIHRLFDYLGF